MATIILETESPLEALERSVRTGSPCVRLPIALVAIPPATTAFAPPATYILRTADGALVWVGGECLPYAAAIRRGIPTYDTLAEADRVARALRRQGRGLYPCPVDAPLFDSAE